MGFWLLVVCASAAFFFAGYRLTCLLASCCIGFCSELFLPVKGAAVWFGSYALWVLTPAKSTMAAAKSTVAAAKFVGWFLLWLAGVASVLYFFGANIVQLLQISSLLAADEVCMICAICFSSFAYFVLVA